MNILDELKEVSDFLKTKKLYLVGGPVRDSLLNREIHDFDFTTPLSVEKIEQLIKAAGRRPIDIGKRFGTIGMKWKGSNIEITTFRQEKYHHDDRKPEVVFVSDLKDDLSRRDFTINSMAMDYDGKIYDYFGGRKDLKNGVIRAVGNPRSRFREDPLRMLRACRFASQLGFGIDNTIYDAIKLLNYKILNISKERWTLELDKLLMGYNVEGGLHWVWELGLFKFMIPELSLQYQYEQSVKQHKLLLHEHTIRAVQLAPKDLDLRWALLLHDVAKPFTRIEKFHSKEQETRTHYYYHEFIGSEFVEKIGRYLNWSNQRRKKVKALILNHMKEESPLRLYDIGAKS